MEDLFLKICNMSVSGGVVILAILAARLILRTAPKKWSYALWIAAGFRLCCPVSIGAAFSVFRAVRPAVTSGIRGVSEIAYIPPDIGMMNRPAVNFGPSSMREAISDILPAATPTASANPMQIYIFIAAYIWFFIMCAFLLYGVIAYWRICRRVNTAVLLQDNIYQSDMIRSPFILGFVRPKIYIPFDINPDRNPDISPDAFKYILAHENYHIKRKDYIIKAFAFILLAIHWFNPLCWIAFYMMEKDMEMSCDEQVLDNQENNKNLDIQKAYSRILLSFASNRRFPAANPLAFGESGVRGRILNALRWKKPTRRVSIIAAALCVMILAACAVNPDADSKAVGSGAVRITETISDETESYYRLEADLKRVSAASQALRDDLKADFERWDALSEIEQIASSHMPGNVSREFDTWADAEAYAGMNLENPLENASWLTKANFYGEGRHISVSAYAPDNEENMIASDLEAAYRDGENRVILDIRLWNDENYYESRDAWAEYVEFEVMEIKSANGGMMIMIPHARAQWSYQNGEAWFVRDGLLYHLNVINSESDEASMRETLFRTLHLFGLDWDSNPESTTDAAELLAIPVHTESAGTPDDIGPLAPDNEYDALKIAQALLYKAFAFDAESSGTEPNIEAGETDGNRRISISYRPVDGLYMVEWNGYFDYPCPATLFYFHHENPDGINLAADESFQLNDFIIQQAETAKAFLTRMYGIDSSGAAVDVYAYENRISVQIDAGIDAVFQVRFQYQDPEPDGILTFPDLPTAQNAMERVNARFLGQHSAINPAESDSTVNLDNSDNGNSDISGIDDALSRIKDDKVPVALALSHDGAATRYDGQNCGNEIYFRNGLSLDYSYTPINARNLPGNGEVVILSAMNENWGLRFYQGGNADIVGFYKGDMLTLYQAKYNGEYGENYPVGLSIARDWYDEAEYQAMGGLDNGQDQIIIPDRGQDYLQAAREYCDAFESLRLQASPGSKYKYNFIKCVIESAPDETEQFREAGEIGENTWAFYLTDIFIPENERAYNWSMAGNTADYTGNDTSIPEGALESYRCCYITREADGWHGIIAGTGW